jgi:nitrogen fixation NifU-like protein
MYSQKVMDHFMNPRHVGEMPGPDGVGEVGNPVCGDMMTFQIKVRDGRIEDVRFKTFGCGAAIAVSSMVADMAVGKTLDEAMQITNKMVAEELDGLPPNKMHCSNLGADALHKAVENYRHKIEEQEKLPEVPAAGEEKAEACSCPFCSSQVPAEGSECKPCGVEYVSCHGCSKPIPKNALYCPYCQAKVK